MNPILNRLREPSTMAGLAALATLFGAPTDTVSAVTQAVVGVAGALAVILPEGKK